MANKKLKVEVELETAKAKRQAKELEQSGSGAPGASVATSAPRSAERLAQSLDRASRSVADFGEKSKASSTQIAHVVRSFAGLGVGMALGYAAKNMERGSARTAVEATGGAAQGASMASAALMAIPGAAQVKLLGTILGAALGAGKVLFDKKGENDAYAKDFAKGEKEYAAFRDWAAHFKSLTGVGRTDMGLSELEDTVSRITTAITELNQEEKSRIATINDAIKAGELDRAQRERDELSTTRSKIAQLEAVRDSYDRQIEAEKKKKPESKPDFRASLSGTDSLQKIGLTGADKVFGAVATEAVAAKAASRIPAVSGFSVPTKAFSEMKFFQQPRPDWSEKATSEQLQRINGDQLKVLEKIEQKLGNMQGGSSWQ